MYQNRIIKSLVAGLMLLLFSLSITPKQMLHDVITGHKHSYAEFQGRTNFQATKNNFQCHWHNNEVESPFNNQLDFQLTHSVIAYSSHVDYYIVNYYFAGHFFSSLRGPPSVI